MGEQYMNDKSIGLQLSIQFSFNPRRSVTGSFGLEFGVKSLKRNTERESESS